MPASRCRKRQEDKEFYEKNLMEHESSSDINKTTNIHNVYNIEKRSGSRQYVGGEMERSGSRQYITSESSSQHLRDAYSLEDLPRVTRLNEQEVQSIDSALLSAEEQDLIDSSLDDERLSADRRYLKHGHILPHDDPYGARRVSMARRISAVTATRRMANQNRGYASDSQSLRSGDRRISVVSSSEVGTAPATPSTLRRNVSAFGEITVMPVGDNEDEDLKIAVEEGYR